MSIIKQKEGELHHARGGSIEDNPYEKGSHNFVLWSSGWYEADGKASSTNIAKAKEQLGAVDLLNEDNSTLELIATWCFKLSRKDALLVMKALGGRLRTPEEEAAAKELGDRMTLQRAAAGREFLISLEHAESKVGT